MGSDFPAEEFPHEPPRIFERRVLSPADLPQPERPARAFGAEPGRADPLPQRGRATYFSCSGIPGVQNRSMKRQRQGVHFGAAFVGKLPRAAQ